MYNPSLSRIPAGTFGPPAVTPPRDSGDPRRRSLQPQPSLPNPSAPPLGEPFALNPSPLDPQNSLNPASLALQSTNRVFSTPITPLDRETHFQVQGELITLARLSVEAENSAGNSGGGLSLSPSFEQDFGPAVPLDYGDAVPLQTGSGAGLALGQLSAFTEVGDLASDPYFGLPVLACSALSRANSILAVELDPDSGSSSSVEYTHHPFLNRLPRYYSGTGVGGGFGAGQTNPTFEQNPAQSQALNTSLPGLQEDSAPRELTEPEDSGASMREPISSQENPGGDLNEIPREFKTGSVQTTGVIVEDSTSGRIRFYIEQPPSSDLVESIGQNIIKYFSLLK